MKRLTLAALALVSAGSLRAQDVKFGGLVQVWATQMMDSNLRGNGAASTGSAYYNLRGEFKENTFSIRRTEIKLSGKITEDVEWEVMVDPAINTSATNPTILQDAAIVYKTGFGVDFKLGQFKNQQTFEGLQSSSELLFAERSQIARVFGDKRDRGVVASTTLGDPKGFGAKLSVGLFNGLTDAVSGKGNDTNAQKDTVARIDLNYGKVHRFGVYTLSGSTDLKDANGSLKALTFAGTAVPSATDILDNKDKTTNLGAYYVYQDAAWHFSGEVISGLLGRRFASLGAATGSALRQHLDQKFMGYVATAAYTTGAHTFMARYDLLNYNQGNDWYTAYNPYTQSAPGTRRLVNGAAVDYTPKYTELTAGYLYAFKPEKLKAANLKLNYIARGKNFLAPNINQTGEQGGNTFVAAFQIAF